MTNIGTDWTRIAFAFIIFLLKPDSQSGSLRRNCNIITGIRPVPNGVQSPEVGSRTYSDVVRQCAEFQVREGNHVVVVTQPVHPVRVAVLELQEEPDTIIFRIPSGRARVNEGPVESLNGAIVCLQTCVRLNHEGFVWRRTRHGPNVQINK